MMDEITTDEEFRRMAIERIRKRSESADVLAYVLVNAFLVAIWAVTGAGFFWPIFPILGWGSVGSTPGTSTGALPDRRSDPARDRNAPRTPPLNRPVWRSEGCLDACENRGHRSANMLGVLPRPVGDVSWSTGGMTVPRLASCQPGWI